MANTYTFTGPGERFVEGDPTAEDYMNVSRENTDHLHEALNTIMNTDNITAGTPPDLTIGFGTSMTPPSAVKTAENAQKIIPVMLDDPMQVWNLQAALQDARNQSWWSEGAPPTHGLLFIHENQNSITWWNLDTDAQYIQIDGAASGIIDDATPVLTGIAFLDFRIYLCGTGGVDVTIIDLLRDTALRYSSAGVEQYDGTLGDFTGTDGYSVLTTAVAMEHDNCNAIDACRDPSLVDEFGRPLHWWAVGAGTATDGPGGVYSPVADAFYDENSDPADTNAAALSPGGVLVMTQDNGTDDSPWINTSIFSISADFDETHFFRDDMTKGVELNLWTGSHTIQDVAVMDNAAPDGGPVVMFAADEGLLMVFPKWPAADTAQIEFTADDVTPYRLGDSRGCWPLNDLNDHSSAGHTLTNNGAVTFSNGGPAGSYANFVAASSQSLSLADHADFGGMAELTVACWIYRDIDSGGDEGLVCKYDQGTGTDQTWNLNINASDEVEFDVDTNVGDVGLNAGKINTGQWYYVVGTVDTSNMRLYINGVEIASTATGHATLDDSAETLFIGAQSSGNTAQDFFDGRIGGVNITASVMSPEEIWWEYQRGLRRIQSGVDGNDALTNLDVKSVRADQASKHWIITTADDNLTILDQFGVPIAQDAAPAGTIRDACIWMPSGQDTPSYAMATSTRVEFVQQTRRIFN